MLSGFLRLCALFFTSRSAVYAYAEEQSTKDYFSITALSRPT
jgi:hypothetical protein